MFKETFYAYHEAVFNLDFLSFDKEKNDIFN